MHVEQETYPLAGEGEEVMVVFRDRPLTDVPPYLHVTALTGPVEFEVRSGYGPVTDDYAVNSTVSLSQVNMAEIVSLPASADPEQIVTVIRVLTGQVALAVHSPLPFRMEFRSRRYRP